MVVDPEIDERVGESRIAPVALDDEHGSRLLAAAVAAGGLSRGERLDQALCEGSTTASNVSASASTVSPETRMFPCAA